MRFQAANFASVNDTLQPQDNKWGPEYLDLMLGFTFKNWLSFSDVSRIFLTVLMLYNNGEKMSYRGPR
jgi:hypothetical protein